MKTLITGIVLAGLMLAATGSAYAGTMMMPKSKTACEKAHMMWNSGMKKCMKGTM